MKTEYREHPLGTPGLSARQRARSLDPSRPLLRFLAGLFPGIRGAGSSWEKGARGEETVAKVLSKLSRDRWMTLHDRPLGDKGRNVDHLVIGPAGVFSINTKNLSGRVRVKRNAFLVNGFPERCLYVARDEAGRVAGRLTAAMGNPVDVTPVIAVLAPELEVVEQPEGVCVIDGRAIAKWLDALPAAIDAATANRVYECARRNAVWREPVAPVAPTSEALG